MRLELNSIKTSLLTASSSVVDKQHLIDDMYEMSKYYQDIPEDIPDDMRDYFKELQNGSKLYNPLEFAQHYFSSLWKLNVTYSASDEDDYVTFKVNSNNGRTSN